MPSGRGREASRGRFITLEGGEGAGKSTQARHLAERLRRLGLDVVVTREPGGSPRAETIRDLLLSGAVEALGPLGEAALFAAARADHVAGLIRPALARGAWVISDRFADSTRVYQGSVDPVVIDALERAAMGECRPDLTVILDVPVEVGLARAAARRKAAADRFEKEQAAVHESWRRAFLALAEAEPERCAVVDGARGEAEVADAIFQVVAERLLPGGREAG